MGQLLSSMASRSASRDSAVSDSLVTQRDEIVFRMEEITRTLRQAFERRIQQTGLTRTQWRILAYLLRSEGVSQSDLARLLDLERATIGQAIDTLEEQGLVERRPCPADRRVWRVHLREAAYDLVPLLRAEADRLHELTWVGLTESDIAFLELMLDRVAANLSTIPG
jgi:MarR family transcriptional regulator for hemolysin